MNNMTKLEALKSPFGKELLAAFTLTISPLLILWTLSPNVALVVFAVGLIAAAIYFKKYEDN